MSGVTLRVFNPRAEIESTPPVSASPGLGSLAGRKIGILNNSKGGGDMLQPCLEKVLKRRFPDIEFRTWRVPFTESPDVKEPRLREIVEYGDGAIVMMAD
ncbi:hypothetical protein ACFLWI_01530 [Chloroflexota bacterium]